MEYKTVQFNYDGDHVEGDEWSLESIARVLRKAGCAVSAVRTSDGGETTDCSMHVTIPENDKYWASMSAVVCVYPSGEIDAISLHRHVEDAYAERDRLLAEEKEKDGGWTTYGKLVVVTDADVGVTGVIDRMKLLEWLDFRGIKYRED